MLALEDISDSRTAERFSVYRCSHCGVGQTVPTPDDLVRYYASYHGNRHGISAAYCVRRRLRLLHQSARPLGGRRLLDIGCGDGAFLAAARKAGWQTAGTEMEPDAARSLGLDVRCDLEQFAGEEQFDCVTLWHSLEHLRDPRTTLSRIKEMLRPDGALLVAVPDNSGWQAKLFGRHWLHLDVPRHLFHFDRRSLAALLEGAGFVAERQWHQEWEYDLIGWSQSAMNALGLQPNIFFELLTRKCRLSSPARLAHLGLGAVLSAAAVPVVAISSSFRRGGTLITRARRR